MMGNHIIKAARCALLPALQHIKKQQQVMGSKKKKEGKNKSKSEKIKSETDRKQPSGSYS